MEVFMKKLVLLSLFLLLGFLLIYPGGQAENEGAVRKEALKVNGEGKTNVGEAGQLSETERLQKNWAALKKRQLSLLPVPKYLHFTGRELLLTGPEKREVCLILEKETTRGLLAVNELQSRFADFANSFKFEVLKKAKEGAYNIIIDNTFPENTYSRKSTLKEIEHQTDQAYGLFPVKEGIILSGRGELGMMYAAVTTRWLINQGEDGVIKFYEASVIDWPDYKFREMARMKSTYLRYTGTKESIEVIKRYVEWLFRMKCNVIGEHTVGAMKSTSVKNTLAKDEEILKAAGEVSRFAAARGIFPIGGDGVYLGRKPKDSTRPQAAQNRTASTISMKRGSGRPAKSAKTAAGWNKTFSPASIESIRDGGAGGSAGAGFGGGPLGSCPGGNIGSMALE